MASYPAWFKIMMVMILLAECICGICLNLAVVASGHKRTRVSHFNGLLCKIDLLISVLVIPLTLAILLIDSSDKVVLCAIQEGTLTFATVANMMTTICISLDRYYAIVLPPNTWLRGTQVKCLKGSIGVLSFIGLCFPFLSLSAEKLSTSKFDDTLSCKHILSILSPSNIYEIYPLLFYIMGALSIVECYVCIIRAAKKRATLHSNLRKMKMAPNTESIGNSLERKRHHRIIKISVFSISSVIICWGPYAVVSLIMKVGTNNKDVNMFYLTSQLIALTSVIWNPLLYSLSVKDTMKEKVFRGRIRLRVQGCATAATHTDAKAEETTKAVIFKHNILQVSPVAYEDLPSCSTQQPNLNTDISVFTLGCEANLEGLTQVDM